MDNMYQRILSLCQSRGIKPGRVCADTGLSRGLMTDLKMGRTKELSAKNTKIIADYFGVSTDYLLGNDTEKESPPENSHKPVPDLDDIKLALFGGGGEVTDEMWEEAVFAAQLIKERYKRKKDSNG